MGELKEGGRTKTTEELYAENVQRQAEIESRLASGGIED
jgi:hypothetical protein